MCWIRSNGLFRKGRLHYWNMHGHILIPVQKKYYSRGCDDVQHPATVLRNMFDGLPYSDVRVALLAGRDVSIHAAKHVQILIV